MRKWSVLLNPLSPVGTHKAAFTCADRPNSAGRSKRLYADRGASLHAPNVRSKPLPPLLPVSTFIPLLNPNPNPHSKPTPPTPLKTNTPPFTAPCPLHADNIRLRRLPPLRPHRLLQPTLPRRSRQGLPQDRQAGYEAQRRDPQDEGRSGELCESFPQFFLAQFAIFPPLGRYMF